MRTFGCYDQYAKHPKKRMSTQLPHYGDDLIMQRINLGLLLTILFALVVARATLCVRECCRSPSWLRQDQAEPLL